MDENTLKQNPVGERLVRFRTDDLQTLTGSASEQT
jgi:hypothetical protein